MTTSGPWGTNSSRTPESAKADADRRLEAYEEQAEARKLAHEARAAHDHRSLLSRLRGLFTRNR